MVVYLTCKIGVHDYGIKAIKKKQVVVMQIHHITKLT
jgi:hypothetical protein